MRRARRPLLALAAAGLAAGVVAALAGCTRDPKDSIRFMIWGSPDETRVVQGYLAAFRQAHPGIRVTLEHSPSMGYVQKLRTLVRGDNLPDVMYVMDNELQWLVEQEALYDLTDLIERDRDELQPDDFYRPIFERFRHRGRVHGVAKDFATLVLYYNRDLFDKWDVPYPERGWTWDDFLAKAKALSRGGDYGFLLETWPQELYPWIWQAGGAVAQDEPPEWLMGKPEYIDRSAEALQFLSDLIWEHGVVPPPSVTRDQQGNTLFVQGRVAMCTYGRWACMDFKHIKAFDWDCIELPRHREQATCFFPVCYAVGARTQHVEEAWTLVKFLTSVESQREVAHSGQAIPARLSVAESEAFLHPRALQGMDVAAWPNTEQVPVGRFPPRFRSSSEIADLFTRGVEPLWTRAEGRPTARALLEELQPRLEAIAAKERAQLEAERRSSD